jgi:hypothetical protein
MKFFNGNKSHKISLVGFHPQQRQDDSIVVMDFAMEFHGDTLKAAPEFLQRIHEIVADEECDVRKISSKTEVMGVDFEFFKLDPDDRMLKNDGAVMLTLDKTVLNKLAIARPQKPIVIDREIELHFTLAYEWDPLVWKWAQNVFGTGFWCKFSGSQVEFAHGKDDDEKAQGVLDAVTDFKGKMQKLADEDGTTLSIQVEGEKPVVIAKPRKKTKKRK